ncbi:YcdB/YcdC domain-containing protein [Aneurinibacillus migulanus]|uniref:YcdB/YcdC repeated domain-containing protein n=1 Tax=Aneurinibacillus migulanus TaxID=47500 RepID=A0A0D1XBE1_ANEMI|nr:YcdB/YcdC domain-containing protein [Aneurinibacillus migulanus]KIV51711.1 hypothetical protein TS65_24250 [Aneurinibacillus migulanus]KON97826.1 hypothetical protein AF333_22725 [Aneurinibacillus migulanus]MED0891052.1 hypothetical protein [Aneurinibacillus migulanus]MED1614260.1 hypothetical protein [Aneurinibacillus migulanus]SDH94918.1 hypothetical protein SAMN04487909_10112 [Aneurinibacillus migulanus]
MNKTRLVTASMIAGSLLFSHAALAAEQGITGQYEKNEQTRMQLQKLPAPVADTMFKLLKYMPELETMGMEINVEDLPDSKKKVYGVMFNKKEAEEYKDLYATTNISEDGILYDFHQYDSIHKSETRPSDSVAKEKSLAFLKLMMGDERAYVLQGISTGGQTSIDKDGNREVTKYASVRFFPLIHGIPLTNRNSIQIDIDKNGRVASWFNNDEDIQENAFPQPIHTITEKEAEKAFLEAASASLSYNEAEFVRIGDTKAEHITRPVLKYMIDTQAIDALTGKPVKNKVKDLYQEKVVSVQGKGKKLSVTSEKEAADLLKTELAIDVAGLELHKDGDGIEQTKVYQWRKNDDVSYVVQTTATGDVVHFGAFLNEKVKKEESITRTEAASRALTFLQTYLPSHIKELQMSYREQEKSDDWVDESKLPPDHVMLISFREMKDNIPIDSRSYNIYVDTSTGKVVGIFMESMLGKIELPDGNDRVSPQQAVKAYVEKYPLTLQYVWPSILNQKADKPLLVYAPLAGYEGQYVDAITGKVEQAER